MVRVLTSSTFEADWRRLQSVVAELLPIKQEGTVLRKTILFAVALSGL